MAANGPVDEDEAEMRPRKPVRITPFLIAESAGIVSVGEKPSPDEIAQRVVKLTRVRLNRQNVADMDGLECCDTATHIYLQHNAITRIDALHFFKSLSFLSLDYNLIEQIECVRHLPALNYLGIAHNRIARVDLAELPTSLRFLDLYGNPCSLSATYRSEIVNALPGLIELDQVEVERATSDDDDGDDGKADAEETPAARAATVGEKSVEAAAEELLKLDIDERAMRVHVEQHIEQLRAGLTDVQTSLGGLREKKAEILARAKERRREMRDLKHIAL